MGRTRSTDLCLRRRVPPLGKRERRRPPTGDIPGFGAIVASALVAAVGRAESFERGRDLSAWLGLVPWQFTTGGKSKLLGISKRGNKYLRRQLIHGARRRWPMSLSATRRSADGQKGYWDAPIAMLLLSPSPTRSPGRCCDNKRGSPQNRPWRRRIRAFEHEPSNANRCLREGDNEMARQSNGAPEACEIQWPSRSLSL